MSSNENEKCDCNKKRCLMNDVNWTRYLNACPVRKSKRKNQTIKTFLLYLKPKKYVKILPEYQNVSDKNTDTLEVEGEKPTTFSSEYEKKIPEKSTFDGSYTADLEVMNTDDIENSNTTYEEPIVSATSTCLPVPEVIYNYVENGYVTNEELIVPDTCLPVPVPISEVDFVVESNANASILNLTIQNFPNDPAYIPDYVPHAQLLLFTQLGPCQPLPSELIDDEYPKTTNTKTGKVRSFHNVYYYKQLKDQPPCKRSWLSYSPSLNKVFCVTCKLFGLPKAKKLNIELLPEHLQSEMSKALYTNNHRIDLKMYHPVLNAHLQKINNVSKNRISFLSNVSQNKLLDIMKEYVRSKILEEVKQSQMFCIIIDTTTDLSSLEQVVFVLRYVYMGKIKERLIALETAEDSSGKGIFDVFQKLMQQYNINWKEYLYAQSYDGAASMEGQYKGLKTLIQKENDKAIYVWCFAHRLNLVIVDTADASTDTKNFFGDLQALVNFMRARKRTAEFVKSQKLFQPLKRVRSMKNFSDARWTSHGRVIQVIYSKFDALLDSLQKLSNSEDRITSAGANNFLKIITSFNFILSMIFMKNIFGITTPLSNYLQSKSLDFIEAINLMNTSLKQLTHKRNDIEYEKLVSETKQFAEINCLPSTSFKENRRRNKKRMPGENSTVEVLSSPENKYKCETYFKVLDKIINSIHTRFDESHEIMKDLALLSPERIALYNNQNQTLPYDAFNRLGTFNELISSINLPSQLHTEMINITTKQGEGDQNSDCELDNSSSSSSIGESNKITDKLEKIKFHTMLHVLLTLDLSVAFPNLYLAFKAYGTIPVSSASAERTFSKVKLIKTRLRTTVNEERLESLLMLSVKKDVEIDYEEIINRFGQSSTILQRALLFV
ncbi:hypothetical protein QTP88_001803 [Uroleucon formosanum]